ncbi:hypothetical protein EV175_001282 [Coemansia sp. RSA 1933]|nr:hypothetical protein EV175_001282 [Coemansia sp. RSA 1933]
MGVKSLTSLLARFAPACISMPRTAELSGWTVAVDTNIFVQRFFRTPPIFNTRAPNIITSASSNGKRHLRGMYNLAEHAHSIGVVPVFVFDGLDRVEGKTGELEARRKERERIYIEYESERARASRIAVLERITACLLDDRNKGVDTEAWLAGWPELHGAPEFPGSLRDDASIEQAAAPLDDTARRISDHRDSAPHTSASNAISWLKSWVEGADVCANQPTSEAAARARRTTIKGRLDELEYQTCRGLLFRLGGSQDPIDTHPTLGDTSSGLATLRQSSYQRLATLACRSEPLTPEHMHECSVLLDAMGFATHVVELAESECVCARLTRAGVADAVCSEDLDVMAFGGRRLLRGFFGQGLNGMVLIDHERALGELGLTYEQFVDMCILCGTDFCSTLEKVGPITALKLVRQHGSIEAILATGLFQQRAGFCYELARNVFYSGCSADIPFTSRDQVRPNPCRATAVIDGLLPPKERSRFRSGETCASGGDPFASASVF